MTPMRRSLAPDLPFVVLGAQGHAAVVVELIEAMGGVVAGCVAPPQSTPFGLPLLGDDQWLAGREGEFRLANGVGSIGDSRVRASVYRQFRELGFTFPALVHPSASVSPSAEIADGAQVMRGAVIQTRVRIGENAIVNTGAIVDHDCAIEAHAHIAPGATLSGGVTIGTGAHVGTGARLIQNLAIGAGATIGAGAVVITSVPGDETVVGVPARKKI
jgi:UDP-perosamine 4-acetyltransferase